MRSSCFLSECIFHPVFVVRGRSTGFVPVPTRTVDLSCKFWASLRKRVICVLFVILAVNFGKRPGSNHTFFFLKKKVSFGFCFLTFSSITEDYVLDLRYRRIIK